MKRSTPLRRDTEKARAWANRRTPLARGKGLKRSGPLRARSSKPSAVARRATQFGEQAAFCRTLPCSCGCGRGGPSHPHHEPPRSLGGLDGDTVSLNWRCHRVRHNVGARAFWAACGKDPEVIKANIQSAMARRAAGSETPEPAYMPPEHWPDMHKRSTKQGPYSPFDEHDNRCPPDDIEGLTRTVRRGT